MGSSMVDPPSLFTSKLLITPQSFRRRYKWHCFHLPDIRTAAAFLRRPASSSDPS